MPIPHQRIIFLLWALMGSIHVMALEGKELRQFDTLWRAVTVNEFSVFSSFEKDEHLSLAKKRKILLEARRGNTLLHYAASLGRHDVISLLLKYQRELKIGFDHLNDEGQRAVDVAAIKGQASVLKAIYRAAPDVFYNPNQDGFTPLWLSVMSKETSQDAVSYLLEVMPAQLINRCNLINGKRQIDLLMAALYYENDNAMNALVANTKVDLSHTCEGETALHYAVKEKVAAGPAFRVFVNSLKPRELDAVDKEGGTALQYSVLNFDQEKLQLLCDNGCDVNLESPKYLPPLHLALSIRSDIQDKSSFEATAFIKERQLDMIRTLVMHDGIKLFKPSRLPPAKSAAQMILEFGSELINKKASK